LGGEDVFRGLAVRGDDSTDAQRQRYNAKISGPLLDRIDIQVDVPEVKFKDIVSRAEGESSERIRERVTRARERRLHRFEGHKIYSNAKMGTREIKKLCPVCADSRQLLETAVTKLGFSARAYNRVLKVARTIADLAAEEDIRPGHVAEAIQYRMMDRYY
jgi:magnesium chelatase family protein